MAHSQFGSATLDAKGTVRVSGPVTVDSPATAEDVAFRFLIVQGRVVVKGDGQGEGPGENGIWRGTAAAEPGSLQAGAAHAVGLAIIAKQEPAGFETLTWSEPVKLEPADGGG